MKRKVLITGLSSALMLSFAEHLDYELFEVLGLSRNPPQSASHQIKWIKGDLAYLIDNPSFLKGVDTVIHAAALTHCFSEKEYLAFNLEASQKLVDMAIVQGVGHFVYISSRTANLKAGGYGKSKFLAEEYIKGKFKNCLIFRPAEVFGGSKNEGIEKVINDVLTKKVVIYPGGESYMAPIDLHDTATIMYQEWQKYEKGQLLFTLNGAEVFSYKSLINRIEQIVHKKVFALAIPKSIMYLIKKVIIVFNLRIGIMPDQVDRFYVGKETENRNFPFKSIDSYILARKESL